MTYTICQRLIAAGFRPFTTVAFPCNELSLINLKHITMKQLLFLLPCFVIVIFSTAKSQEMAKHSAAKPIRLHSGTPKKIASESILLKFHDDYPNIVDDAWSATENGYLVSFSSGEIQYNVFLNDKGQMTSQIRYYKESQLPVDIRKLIKDNFPCQTISCVREIISNNKMAFLITIDNGLEWRTLRIVDKEMELIETYKKG
jgi:hypothetical protein